MNRMGTPDRPATHGATAPDRGVFVPFTAPALFGVLARRAERGLDLVLANQAGGKGCYVLPWAMIPDILQPSAHDLTLGNVLARMADLSPQGVRSAAREVAATGYAGRPARQAALAAQDRLARSLAALWRTLATGLARTVLPADTRLIDALARDDTAAPDGAGLEPLAAKLDCEPMRLADALARLSRSYVGVAGNGRAASLLRRAEQLRGTVPDGTAGSVELDELLRELRPAIASARTVLDDPHRLVAAWRTDPVRAQAPADRVDALSDGWDRVLALCADPAGDAEPSRNDAAAIPDEAVRLMRLLRSNLSGTLRLNGVAAPARTTRLADVASADAVRNERLRTAELRMEADHD